jgi:hypothetical protein
MSCTGWWERFKEKRTIASVSFGAERKLMPSNTKTKQGNDIKIFSRSFYC